ncbi:MAG TPA: zinc finger protein [Umezawaea sp.]|jgi:hypothetical protein|nr:zinc finger protein [Umezawaea sp.]
MPTALAQHRWHDADGRRHAISLARYPLPPRPDGEIDTLCGTRVTLSRQDFPRPAEYRPHKKTCLECDAVWRTRENLSPRR